MKTQNAKLAEYLVYGILALLPAYLVRFSILGIPTTVLEIAIYLLFIFYFLPVCAGRLFISGRAKFYVPDRSWLWPIGIFVLGALIGLFISPEKRIALGQFKGFIFDPLLFALILYEGCRAKIINRHEIVNSLIVGGALVGLASWFLPGDPQGRLFSVFAFEVNPSANYLALFLVPILVLAISRIKSIHPITWLKLEIIAIVLIVSGLVLSDSRGGILGLVAGLLYLVFHMLKKRFAKIFVVLIAILCFIIIGYFARPDLSASPDSGRITTSNNIRYEIWKTTAEIITKNPKNFIFGVGLGNYQYYFTELTKARVNYPEFIAPKALTPHNVFLAMWMSGGIMMLVGFVWLLVLAFRQKDALPAQAALVAVIGHGLVDTPYFKNDLSVLFWALFVLAMLGSSKK
ncbi:O-antigen ligase family protein [Candidatus Berkelbacteria bacterium]|nr:O-antigen ligase family protein [Candidatus Berkelbacteria bacterium]